MILSLRLRPLPSPTPVSHSCPFSSPLHAHADASSGLHAASARRFDNTEARSSAHALRDRSVACRLWFSVAFIAPSRHMSSSIRCFSDMAHSSKRLRKAFGLNCGSRDLDSDCQYTFDPKFRVSALYRRTLWESPDLEREQIDDDGVQSTVKCSNGNKKYTENIKSAEELHFEAIEGYLLRYEHEDSGYYGEDGSTAGCESNTAQLEDSLGRRLLEKAVSDGEAVDRPINENGYLDISIDLSLIDDRRLPDSQLIGRNGHIDSQNDLSSEMKEIRLPSKVSKSIPTASVSDIDGPKNTYAHNGISQTMDTSQDRDADRNESLCIKKFEKNKIPHTEKYQSQDEELESNAGCTKSDNTCDLSEEQKIRMEMNKAAAMARRNMRCCENAVAQSEAKELRFPKFESLLVEKSWAEALKPEFEKPYMDRLHQFVSQEAAGRIPIYPPPAKLFNAFNSCPMDKVKVVILGQDPYHGPGQAMGLCFSVEKGSKLPSSLTNIFLEIQSDLNCDFPTHGNLEKWAHQGVLLLNTVLTVRDRHPNSHAKKGWEFFTDAAIRTLVQQRSGVVFLLWGNQAQEKLRLINKTSHHILKAYHPSGISAHRGFFRCRHFSKTNQLLIDEGLLPIDWQL